MNLKNIRGPKALLLMAGAAAVLVIGALLITSSSTADESAEDTAGMQSMEGMDMGGGMSMPMGGTVQLTGAQIREFGVTFGTAERRTLESEVRTVGIVNFDETRMTQVAPKFGGYIERLHVDFTGQVVRAGQPLLEIYSPELVSAQEELLLAAGLDQSLGQSPIPGVSRGNSNLADVARRRLRLWDISDAQIDRILESGRVRRTLTLYAPTSGIVVEKNVVTGQATRPGETLYTIADLREVWVEAELRERDAGSVREGTEARVEFGAFPGPPVHGRVEYVYPTLEAAARTLKARIAIANPDGRIKPGMYATVRFSTPSATALTVPAPAVLYTGERAIVFVDMGGGKLMPHEVETGRASGDYVEILSGLEPGQRVVTSAQYILDSESNMAEVMKSMIGMTGEGMDMGGMDMSDGSMEGMKMDDGSGMEGMEMQGADTRGMPMDRKER